MWVCDVVSRDVGGGAGLPFGVVGLISHFVIVDSWLAVAQY